MLVKVLSLWETNPQDSPILKGAQSLREPNPFGAKSLLELNPQEILSFEGAQSLREPNPQESPILLEPNPC